MMLQHAKKAQNPYARLQRYLNRSKVSIYSKRIESFIGRMVAAHMNSEAKKVLLCKKWVIANGRRYCSPGFPSLLALEVVC